MIFNIVSLIIGFAGLLLTVAQEIRVRKFKQKDLLSYKRMTKNAQAIMGRLEAIKMNLPAGNVIPLVVYVEWGQAYEGTRELVMSIVENLLFQRGSPSKEELTHWKESGFLTGYVETAFKELSDKPPQQGITWFP